jgi:hypothetical protein
VCSWSVERRALPFLPELKHESPCYLSCFPCNCHFFFVVLNSAGGEHVLCTVSSYFFIGIPKYPICLDWFNDSLGRLSNFYTARESSWHWFCKLVQWNYLVFSLCQVFRLKGEYNTAVRDRLQSRESWSVVEPN